MIVTREGNMGKGNHRLLPDVTASYIDNGKSLRANLRVCSDKFLIL
jgi:hypothetical protein